MKLPIDRYDRLPEALAGISAREIRSVFPNSSLVYIEGERPQPMFVSTLLHGNELTSFSVLQHLERSCRVSRPPRSLIVFVGNVDAAAAGVRHLDETPDYNRIWAGGDTPWHAMADEVKNEAMHAGLFASVDIHNAAGSWNKALLDNSARPSGVLVYAPAEAGMGLSHEQYERLKEELEQGFQGAGNAGRPLLLEGGLDWKATSLSPRDMDFTDAKHAAARDIALAFGVPPMLLGIPGDNTYSNYQEANRAFWRQGVLPLAGKFAKAFSAWLAPAFGADLRLAVDLDRIDALGAEREALWNRLREADFLTPDEKRAAVGYGPLQGSGRAPA